MNSRLLLDLAGDEIDAGQQADCAGHSPLQPLCVGLNCGRTIKETARDEGRRGGPMVTRRGGRFRRASVAVGHEGQRCRAKVACCPFGRSWRAAIRRSPADLGEVVQTDDPPHSGLGGPCLWALALTPGCTRGSREHIRGAWRNISGCDQEVYELAEYWASRRSS
jgi:hypothetical protein